MLSETEETGEKQPEKLRKKSIEKELKNTGKGREGKIRENENTGAKYQAERKRKEGGERKGKERRRKNTCQGFSSKYYWIFSDSKPVTLSVNLRKITGRPRLFFFFFLHEKFMCIKQCFTCSFKTDIVFCSLHIPAKKS